MMRMVRGGTKLQRGGGGTIHGSSSGDGAFKRCSLLREELRRIKKAIRLASGPQRNNEFLTRRRYDAVASLLWSGMRPRLGGFAGSCPGATGMETQGRGHLLPSD